MNKGFVILAQNTSTVDYIKCAEVLAKNIKRVMPDACVSLITDDIEYSKYFDKVIALPYGDKDPEGDWKLINDWQVYEASPYDYTIKLEADLYLPQSIDFWWDVLKEKDLVISSTIRNYKQEISNVRVYRRFLDDNNLPNVYNSLTYFKKSEFAEKFFILVRNIFENWDSYRSVLKCKIDEEASTDWVYSIACHILGEENTTLRGFDAMSMIHMKQFVNELPSEDWTQKLIYEVFPHSLRINTIPQLYPFHYHIKDFCSKLDI
jgi:hypothetical protein